MLFRYIGMKDEKTVDLILSVLLLLFKSYHNYALFTDLTDSQKSLLLSCTKMKRRSVYEQALTLILISILRTDDVGWFELEAFTDSILMNYKTVSSSTQILISPFSFFFSLLDLVLRQFMHLSSAGYSLVGYTCSLEDVRSIFELNLPWVKPYVAFILFTRLSKGFKPRLSFWSTTSEDTKDHGLLLYMRECLQGTSRIKARIRQILTPSENGCEADRILDEFMKKRGISLSFPLSYYEVLNLTGTTCMVMGEVKRSFLCRNMKGNQLTEENENNVVKNLSMKMDKNDPLHITVKIHNKSRRVLWEKNDMKSRYFVLSDRYLYE